MNLSGIDVNLIVALHALLRERSVTRAARAVGLGQSSMSHALARLRHHFGDPLLVPAGRGLALTERAVALIAPVDLAVAQLGRVFGPADAFDPRSAERTFRVAATDNLELYLLPKLVAILAREAPGIDLRFRGLPRDWPRALERGEIDLKLGRKYAVPAAIHDQDLLTERLICLLRRGHPAAREALSLEEYAALSHVLVAQNEAPAAIDEALAAHGLRRRVAVTISHFLVAPFVVAASDHALTISERLAGTFSSLIGVTAVPLPVPVERYTLTQAWAERSHADPGHRWLRETVARALA